MCLSLRKFNPLLRFRAIWHFCQDMSLESYRAQELTALQFKWTGSIMFNPWVVGPELTSDSANYCQLMSKIFHIELGNDLS